jgi:hypothetical protein
MYVHEIASAPMLKTIKESRQIFVINKTSGNHSSISPKVYRKNPSWNLQENKQKKSNSFWETKK